MAARDIIIKRKFMTRESFPGEFEYSGRGAELMMVDVSWKVPKQNLFLMLLNPSRSFHGRYLVVIHNLCTTYSKYIYIIIIIYHDFLPTPRRGSHVTSGKTHTQSSRYTP